MSFEQIIKIPSPADAILQDWVAAIRDIQPGLIQGIYLTGSIPLDDYHPGKSDIDFIVVCNELPADQDRVLLKSIHQTIKRKYKGNPLSGFYITPGGLDIKQAANTKALNFHEGKLQETSFDMSAVALYELKTTAVTLYGVPVEDLPVHIRIEEVNDFLFNNINTYWKKWLAPSVFSRERLMLVLMPRLTEWVLLGMARQLYTLQTGSITSKTDAGYYCLEHLPSKYHPIINEAVAIRKDIRQHLVRVQSSYSIQPSLMRAYATVECAGHILQLFNKTYRSGLAPKSLQSVNSGCP